MANHMLYLASGSSRRFGSNKLLCELEGKPLFLHGLDMLCDLRNRHPDWDLTVVSRYEAIRQAARARDIPAVDSPESEKGISHTIRAGLRALGTIREEDFFLFLVADQPYLQATSVERLMAQAVAGTQGASICYGDRPGNPTLFSGGLVPELLALEGDTGGRAVLRKHSCIFVQAGSAKELEDVDVPAHCFFQENLVSYP